jgi:DNA-binding CsgD family transcriptional regulator
MEFSRETFVAFSHALAALYSEARRDTKIAALVCELHTVFHGCHIETTSAPPPHIDLEERKSTTLSLAIPGSAKWITLSSNHGLDSQQKFLAREISAHLDVVFGPARPSPAGACEPPDARRARALGLTPRECEVLERLMQGRRDAEIAADIGAALRTVNKHVENILRKLGVETRGGAAHAAAERLPRIPHIK